MKYAWVENGIIRDLSKANPTEVFHPDVAALYTEQVPNGARRGDAWDGTVLTPAIDPEPPALPPIARSVVNAVEFQFLFTATERAAIAASADTGVASVRGLLADPRLQQVDLGKAYIADYLDLLDQLTLITKVRKNKILAGRFPRE